MKAKKRAIRTVQIAESAENLDKLYGISREERLAIEAMRGRFVRNLVGNK